MNCDKCRASFGNRDFLAMHMLEHVRREADAGELYARACDAGNAAAAAALSTAAFAATEAATLFGRGSRYAAEPTTTNPERSTLAMRLLCRMYNKEAAAIAAAAPIVNGRCSAANAQQPQLLRQQSTAERNARDSVRADVGDDGADSQTDRVDARAKQAPQRHSEDDAVNVVSPDDPLPVAETAAVAAAVKREAPLGFAIAHGGRLPAQRVTVPAIASEMRLPPPSADGLLRRLDRFALSRFRYTPFAAHSNGQYYAVAARLRVEGVGDRGGGESGRGGATGGRAGGGPDKVWRTGPAPQQPTERHLKPEALVDWKAASNQLTAVPAGVAAVTEAAEAAARLTGTVALASTPPPQSSTQGSGAFVCKYCRIHFADRTMYLLHAGLHGAANPWQCNICSASCADALDFAIHSLHR